MTDANLEYVQDTQTLVGSRKRELIDVQTGEQIFVDQIMCRNRKSDKQDIPDVNIWYRFALFAYLARMLLDCHTSSGSTLAATADL